MAHLRKQIRDAVVTTLTGLSTTASRVYSGRATPLAVDASPSLLIDVGAEQIVTSSMGAGARNRLLERTLEIEVRAMVKAVSGYLDTLDAIVLEVEQALAAEQSLDGLAKSVQPAGYDAPEIDGQGEKTVAELTLRFNVTYYAALNAPDTPR
jgi:hypothetical protein